MVLKEAPLPEDIQKLGVEGAFEDLKTDAGDGAKGQRHFCKILESLSRR